SAVGTLTLRRLTPADSTRLGSGMRLYDGAFIGTIQVDFAPLLGRPMSCLDSTVAPSARLTTPDSVLVSFTPGVADCGFSAVGRIVADTIIATWSETSFIGPVAGGPLRMVKQRR